MTATCRARAHREETLKTVKRSVHTCPYAAQKAKLEKEFAVEP